MIYIILAVVGLAFGSFVNAFVWRWRQKEHVGQGPNAKKSHKDEYSILHGRSMCPHCRHELAASDLVPVLSWLALRGKCRYCRKPISAQYPLVELITAALFILSYTFWPLNISGAEIAVFVLWLVALVGLVALAVYDLRWQLLPNKIVFGLLAVAVLQAVIRIAAADDPLKAFLNIFFGALVSGGVFYILFQVSRGRWIGGGDVKLGLLLGVLVATPGRGFLLIFLASLLGVLVSLPFMAGGRLNRTSRVPFGPYLILAAIIVVLFGHTIIHWYQTNFLPPTFY